MVVLHRQKRGSEVGKTKRGKGSKWMVVVDGEGIPLGGTLTSASRADVTAIYRRCLGVPPLRHRQDGTDRRMIEIVEFVRYCEEVGADPMRD